MFFLMLLGSLTFGQKPDYIDIKKGQHAPFSGKLLTNKALAKIIANNQASLDKAKADYDFSLKQEKLESKLNYDLLNLKYKSEIEMYKSMIDVRNKKIANAQKKESLQKWQIYGGFVLGAASSIAIFYSVNGN